jgi:hypothetical protein
LIAASFSGCGDSTERSKVEKVEKVESPELVSERAVAEVLAEAGDARPDAQVTKCTEAAAGSTCVVKFEGGGAFSVTTRTASNGCTVPATLTLKSSPPRGSALDEVLGEMSVGDGTVYPSSIALDNERCS